MKRSLNVEQMINMNEFLSFHNFDPVTVMTHRHSCGCTRIPQTLIENPLVFWREKITESGLVKCQMLKSEGESSKREGLCMNSAHALGCLLNHAFIGQIQTSSSKKKWPQKARESAHSSNLTVLTAR